MSMKHFSYVLLFILLACSKKKELPLFEIRHGASLGIDFQNTITTNDSINALTFEYIYNGSGVGVGDFNNDGLQDIFFGGNQVSSKLYLNKGSLQFEDFSSISGINTNRWITGVSVVDINQDGWVDIYLCVAGKTTPENKKNLLYINQGLQNGIPVFIESAALYGLDDGSYSTMAAFFDYDKDGDLDMYLVNNWLETFNRNNLREKRRNGEAESTDRLFRNNGDNTFTNVSRAAGILMEGYGLGITICDLNQDSWPDVYVSNDFMSNDLLWINQRDGTFKNEITHYLKHQTHNGMGMDVADFNNDELLDIVVVDMLPPDHKRQKMMTPGSNFDIFHMSLQQDYQPQYMRNTLQLNRGITDGKALYSEIAFMAGVAKTDWSWAPLFADFDNDGWKDLFIANGYRKDVTDLDFIFFGLGAGSPFGTQEKRRQQFYGELEKLPEVKLTNYIYKNTGSLTFEDKTTEWGIKLPTFTNGAAYADLDNAGDLELITNNIDQEVIIYENKSNERRDNKNHFLRLLPEEKTGEEKIKVYTRDQVQYFEMTPYRGFQSSVEHLAHVGLGNVTRVDSVVITWPDSATLTLTNIKADTVIRYSKNTAITRQIQKQNQPAALFEPQDFSGYIHIEKSPSDIKQTRTLMHELSTFGPCLTVGDVNGDTLDDIFIGAEYGVPSSLFIQDSSGKFIKQKLTTDSTFEDGGALLFDIDNDHDLDLYVASCSPSGRVEAGRHRLYLNDGKGNFSLTANALPEITASASCVEAADYDLDGDLDLFIGGRLKVNEYPLSPRSFVLRNENGKMVDVTAQLNDDLIAPGMVSSAVWSDLNNDKKPDLIIAGEWNTIQIFINDGDTFTNASASFGTNKLSGWWNCIQVKDLNNDGFPEIIAGNAGRNSFFQPDEKNPVELVVKDFDQNGVLDPLTTYYNPVDKQRFLVHNRLVLIDQIPGIKKKFEKFSQYADATFHDALTRKDLEGSTSFQAQILESIILVNEGGNHFKKIELPEIAQISTINDILVDDLNNDGHEDLVCIGNSYSQETLYGMYDASFSTILLGDGKLNWTNLSPVANNLIIDGDARYVKKVKTTNGEMLAVTNNNGPLQLFRVKKD